MICKTLSMMQNQWPKLILMVHTEYVAVMKMGNMIMTKLVFSLHSTKENKDLPNILMKISKQYSLKLFQRIKTKSKKIIKEANENQKTVERKQKISEAIDDIASQFIDWALNDSNTQRRMGGPVNALQAMHDYYYNNDDDALYIAAEAFAEAKGIEDAESNIYMILDAAKNAAEYYFNSNPDEEQV